MIYMMYIVSIDGDLFLYKGEFMYGGRSHDDRNHFTALENNPYSMNFINCPCHGGGGAFHHPFCYIIKVNPWPGCEQSNIHIFLTSSECALRLNSGQT